MSFFWILELAMQLRSAQTHDDMTAFPVATIIIMRQ